MGNIQGFVNGNVLTLDADLPVCEAVLVVGDTISARGSTAEISELCLARGGQLLDLAGKTMVPGFHDCHVHMMGTGLNARGINMYDCESIDTVLGKVAAAAREYPEDQWIFGKRLDESRLKEGRSPTAGELDSAAPRHPVYIIDRGWHYTLVNTKAFQLLGLSETMPGVRKTSDGAFSGRLHEQANAHAKLAFFERQDETQREAALRHSAGEAAAAGVTTVHAMEGGSLFADSDIPIIQAAADDLPVRTVLYWGTEDLQRIQAAGLTRMGGDILLDGSIGSRTAAFEEAYVDDPNSTGFLYYDTEKVKELITSAHLANIQIGFHAIGERAITQILDCFSEVLERHPRPDHRHRLEHFGFPKSADIQRAADLGVVVSTQPAFSYLRGGSGKVYNTRLGPERDRAGYPLRSLLDAGLTVGGGSDSDVTPIDPMLGIHAAVNPPYPENGVTVLEALRMFTMEAARTAFEENIKGSIEIGKLADFTVLGENPLAAPAMSLKDIGVEMTVKGGEVVYRNRG